MFCGNRKARSDKNHRFPKFPKLSRVLPGDERIHENVIVDAPITGVPCGTVHTVFDCLRRAKSISDNGSFLAEIVDGKYKWTDYNTVIRESEILGSAMVQLGIKPGTRCGVAGIHSIRYMMAMHGMVSYRITIVPLYHNSKMEQLCKIVDNCELSLIFCDSPQRATSFAEKKRAGHLKGLNTLVVLNGECPGTDVEGLKMMSYDEFHQIGKSNRKPVVPPTKDDIYLICHTSGTTGHPKGVMLSHHNLLTAMAGLYTQWVLPPNNFNFDKKDVYFSFLSLAHVYEHLMQTFVIYIGGKLGIYSGDTTKLLSDIRLLQPTIVSLVPRLLNKFYEHIHSEVEKKNVIAKKMFNWAKKSKLELLRKGIHRYDTIWDKLVFDKLRPLLGGHLRMITTGGAPVTANVKEFTRIAYGCPMMEGYGQTECGAAGTLNLPFEFESGVVGAPAPWAQVKLVDVIELGYLSKEDKGEICFRGAAVMKGYYHDEELTKATVDGEGWLHTGDIGRWTKNGGLAVIDRKNALFKMAQGDFVSPEQIEAIYLDSPLIGQLFVTGRTDRSFLVGIAVVNTAAVRLAVADRPEFMKLLDSGEFLENSEFRRFFLTELNSLAKENGLQSIEILKDVRLIDQEWTAESTLVTPTLKLRRHLLREKYSSEIEQMYSTEKTI